MNRVKSDINFSLNLKQDQVNKLNKEQQGMIATNYLNQVNSLLMGAIATSQKNLDLSVKINIDVLEHIKLSPDLEKMMQSKNMMIFVTFIGTGDGIVLK